jgi:hypothetical protein
MEALADPAFRAAVTGACNAHIVIVIARPRRPASVEWSSSEPGCLVGT